jgi:hypothetical protein
LLNVLTVLFLLTLLTLFTLLTLRTLLTLLTLPPSLTLLVRMMGTPYNTIDVFPRTISNTTTSTLHIAIQTWLRLYIVLVHRSCNNEISLIYHQHHRHHCHHHHHHHQRIILVLHNL